MTGRHAEQTQSDNNWDGMMEFNIRPGGKAKGKQWGNVRLADE